jgi:hypothetical protein
MWIARFRESRLYVQVIMSLGLVGISGLLAFLPTGERPHVRDAFYWVVAHDSDLPGAAGQAGDWIRTKGGWDQALTALWDDGSWQARAVLQDYLALPRNASSREEGTVSEAGAGPSLHSLETDWSWPVHGAVLYGFGWHETWGKAHLGMDIVAPAGTPVVAAADGVVRRIFADEDLGEVVEVDHGELIGLYAQVDRVVVVIDQRVRRGDRLASVGRPVGAERGMRPHLHFEVLTPEGIEVDPAYRLPRGRQL